MILNLTHKVFGLFAALILLALAKLAFGVLQVTYTVLTSDTTGYYSWDLPEGEELHAAIEPWPMESEEREARIIADFNGKEPPQYRSAGEYGKLPDWTPMVVKEEINPEDGKEYRYYETGAKFQVGQNKVEFLITDSSGTPRELRGWEFRVR